MKWVKQSIHYWCPDTKEQKFLGQNVTVAILDTGISPHPDFKGRILSFRDFSNTTGSSEKVLFSFSHFSPLIDNSGHGTHVAGILAGSGLLSSGTYAGIAPFCNLIIGKVLDQNGKIRSCTYGNVNDPDMELRVDITDPLNSIYDIFDRSVSIHQKLLLLTAVESLWDLGLVVVVSAGNYGPAPGSVTVPGSSPKVITVGVPDTFPLIHTQRHPLNYSGRGPTDDCIVKPDVFAPGTGIVSCNAFYSQFPNAPPYLSKTGTSMAAPVVSGAIACLLSKYPFLTNAEVKLKLHASCVQIPGTESGWGILDFSRLLE